MSYHHVINEFLRRKQAMLADMDIDTISMTPSDTTDEHSLPTEQSCFSHLGSTSQENEIFQTT